MGSPLPAGTTLDRYETISQLGAGGMGEVYLAEDTRLHRRVIESPTHFGMLNFG